MPLERPLFGSVNTITPDSESTLGDITYLKPRTMTVSCRCSYYPSATQPARVNLYFSPDGVHFDTVPFAYFDVILSPRETVQQSVIVEAPEEGHMRIAVQNLDPTHPVRNVFVWITLQEWEVTMQ